MNLTHWTLETKYQISMASLNQLMNYATIQTSLNRAAHQHDSFGEEVFSNGKMEHTAVEMDWDSSSSVESH